MAEFKCTTPGCGWSGKTKGALTQHTKREHTDDALAKLRTEFGEAAPRPGGVWNDSRPLKAVPSGVPSIDYAIGIGGVPQGSLIELFGPPKIGKSFTALTFSAHAQKTGGRAGYLDTENVPGMTTFMQLVPGLDMDALEFGQPGSGDEALEIAKRYIKTRMFQVFTIDSLHACIPEASLDIPIGSPAGRAALARLLSEALPVIEHVAAGTPTAVIMVNHQKTKPGVQYGREWYTPGGSAPEYYSSVRLRVWGSNTYKDVKTKQQIGHKVKVKVEASKVAAPFAQAEYDLFYQEGTVSIDDRKREVKPGIDIGSNWYSVLKEEGRFAKSSNGKVYDTETGENLGTEVEVTEALEDEDDSLMQVARDIVYPEAYR